MDAFAAGALATVIGTGVVIVAILGFSGHTLPAVADASRTAQAAVPAGLAGIGKFASASRRCATVVGASVFVVADFRNTRALAGATLVAASASVAVVAGCSGVAVGAGTGLGIAAIGSACVVIIAIFGRASGALAATALVPGGASVAIIARGGVVAVSALAASANVVGASVVVIAAVGANRWRAVDATDRKSVV